jgi:transposase-like protein
MATAFAFKCPACSSEALYRYGHVHSGRQRYKCIVCGRQFLLGSERHELKTRPACPSCGLAMHVYKREMRVLRFRCSDYPDCKGYTKISFKEGLPGELLCT